MAQEAPAQDDWDFDLSEHVTLLWAIDKTGIVIGRTEQIHSDPQYLVEFTNDVGVLVRAWVWADAIDHIATRH